MGAFIKGVSAVSRIAGVFAAAFILVATLVVCQMVFVRYVLNQSTVWQTELAAYLLIASVFIGSPYVLMTRGHVYVDLLPLWSKPRMRMVLAVVSFIVSFLFCVLLAWKSWIFLHEAWVKDWTTDTVWGPPLWAVYMSMPIGLTLLSLQLIVEMAAVLTGREAPFGIADDEGLKLGLAEEDLVGK
ncbi:TRAP transporter small permease subunit [Caenispirillum salinarum]|uniref:TRAP transporter small permease subunit n=1 Tax=Caenispirillum salinarum TaxID=859058 RepID=UPI00384D945F